jgi:phosphate transport system permease protein
MGATRLETAFNVVVPAAISGIAGAFVLAMSRAVGETMVVAIAGGQQPNLTFNPTEPAATITAFIAQVAKGDLPHKSLEYFSIYAAGLALLVITLVFNLIAFWLQRTLREEY